MAVRYTDLTPAVFMLNFLAVLVMWAELLRTRLH
jgi:hypothetical protein